MSPKIRASLACSWLMALHKKCVQKTILSTKGSEYCLYQLCNHCKLEFHSCNVSYLL